MSSIKSSSPDVAALIPILRKVVDLCRKLELPKEAAVFARLARRFEKKPPPWERAETQALNAFCHGLTILAIWTKLGRNKRPFDRICREFYDYVIPREPSKKAAKRRHNWKAIKKSKTFWELTGESELHAVTIPNSPRAGRPTTVRLTLSNPYGPLDKVEFLVRVGNPNDDPTDEEDSDSAPGWVQAQLVEEIVYVDGEEKLRSKTQKSFKGETPWDGTYDAKLVLPPGQRSIEIKIVSRHRELRSMVLSDWNVPIK